MIHYPLYQAENQISIAAIHKEDELKHRTMEMAQIVEGINTICGHEDQNNVSTIPHPNEAHFANEDHKDQQEV